MTFDKKWRFPPKMILSRIQFSTEKRDRLSLTDDSCHSPCATDEATKQENSMFSNGTKRTGSIAPDTMLISVFDLTTAVFPAREVQLTWRAAGCFSTPSHLLLSLRKLSRGKPPHAAAGWILIPVLWICIGKKKKKKGKDWWKEAYLFEEVSSEDVTEQEESLLPALVQRSAVCSRETYQNQTHKSRYIRLWEMETDLQQYTHNLEQKTRKKGMFCTAHILV